MREANIPMLKNDKTTPNDAVDDMCTSKNTSTNILTPIYTRIPITAFSR